MRPITGTDFQPVALAACVIFTTQCSVGHPVVGIFPADESEGESDGLLLAALAPAGLSPDASTPDGGSPTTLTPVVILYTGANTAGDFRNGQPTARQGADLHCATGRTAVQIANNWTELLDTDTPLAMDLQTAGISTFRWRSFSNIDGSLSSFNCVGGTNAASGSSRYGDRDTTGTDWISDTQTFCSDTYRLLCVCF
ncbi:MAG: hypothetical protein NXI24_23470 [bacterium]|nr:hypothetical protein [bacterium]